LSAGSGQSALQLANTIDGNIDLLLSDVGYAGYVRAGFRRDLKKLRPNIHVMLMSGFADGNLLLLNYGWAFIQEPFVAKKLAEMVTEVLQTPDKSQGTRGFDTRKDIDDKA
jgi:DNA-binding NtrC family response regulator